MRNLAAIFLAGGSFLMAQDPVDFSGWLKQGVEQFKTAHYPKAVISFQRAIALDPSKPVAHLYLGTSYMQQYIPGATSPENELTAQHAGEEFQRVLAMEPSNRVALGSLASLNLNQKKWDEALEWYGKLIEADPSNADAYYTLGFVAWSKWYPIYSQPRRDAGMKPETPGPLPDAAVRSSLNGQYGPMLQAGIDALNKALQINPQYDDAMAYLNLLIRERADLRDSVAECQQDVATADEWVQKALATKKAKAQQRTTSANFVPPPPPPPPPQAGVVRPPTPSRIRIAGNVQDANILTRVPPEASNLHGDVLLAVIIDKEGNVIDIRVNEGNPMLIRPAMDAVKQWKYRPTLLNDTPVEVETTVKLTF
jgi:TonB family protein